MEKYFAWITENKEWLFSGGGVVVVAWVVRLIFKKDSASSTQSIRAGNDSINVQAGRDVSVVTSKNRNDVE